MRSESTTGRTEAEVKAKAKRPLPSREEALATMEGLQERSLVAVLEVLFGESQEG